MTHNSRCANAKGPKCECSCGGKLHGTGVTLPLPPPYFGTPSSGTPSSGTPSSGTPSSGTPSSGTPSSGTPSTKSRYLCIPMGGTVAQMIRQFLGEKFTCTCGHTIKIKEFIGYPDKYGYPDGSGHTWEIYITCPDCKRWWIIGEIPIRRSIRLIPEAKRLPIVLKSYVEECMPQFELQEEDGYFLLISRDCPLSQGITSKTPTCGEIASALEYCVEWITGQKHEVKEIECKATGHPADVFMVEKAATV